MAIIFEEYNFEVKYKPGKQNALADALSRRPDYELSPLTTISSPIPELIRSAYAKDEQFVALLRSSKNSDSGIKLPARLRARLHRFSIDNNLLLYFTDIADPPRVVVPHDEDLKYRILYGHTILSLVVISVEKRPTALSARVIGGPKFSNRSAHMFAHAKRATG